MTRWLIASAVLVAGCGGSAGSSTRVQRPATPATAPTTTSTSPAKPRTPAKPAPAPPVTAALPPANNGSLPQTDQRPSASTPTFRAEMAALWTGIRTDSVHAAMPAFFPESAYAQVKAIADPQSDWENRLVGNFAQDILAAHRLLGSAAPSVQLVDVEVPTQFIHWVPPGSCYNRLGYWEVPNSRVVYRAGGQIRSFGIASMISWRGIWYVVHMGSVTAGAGLVDDPEVGRGVPAASSTC